MAEQDRIFNRFPPFIREYIFSHSWENLRAVQVAAVNASLMDASTWVV